MEQIKTIKKEVEAKETQKATQVQLANQFLAY